MSSGLTARKAGNSQAQRESWKTGPKRQHTGLPLAKDEQPEIKVSGKIDRVVVVSRRIGERGSGVHLHSKVTLDNVCCLPSQKVHT